MDSAALAGELAGIAVTEPHGGSRPAETRTHAVAEPDWIFADYLGGDLGDRAIATRLNRDGVPCPSALRPDQNRHRRGDGWQGSTVRAILENPRYTGYAFFGRWRKFETLLDPDDVAAGHVVKFRRSSPDRVVRSRRPAHPALVSVEEFTQAQLLASRGQPAECEEGRSSNALAPAEHGRTS